ncbi:MAG: hypothetical protein ACRDL7_06555, partial [Gaiellaceae bacterium]
AHRRPVAATGSPATAATERREAMFTDYHDILALRDRPLPADRRPIPSDSEIRLRVKRLIRVYL